MFGSPGAQPIAFDVASVKPNVSRDAERDATLTTSRLRLGYVTLRDLVLFAYQRPNGNLRSDAEVSGGPRWMDSDHFDIVAAMSGMPVGLDGVNTAAGAATASETSGIDRVRAMMRTLLADRFKLAAHHELREVPVYELVMARSDRAPGRQLHRVDIDCAARRQSKGSPESTGRPCGGFRQISPGHYEGGAVPMQLVADLLEGVVQRNVVDRTNLTGVFDVELRFAPEQLRSPDPANPLSADLAPSIFTAVREQLGLRLSPTRAKVDVLIIDRAERPTPD
jgi:uncharacterized protein (TIGR03435 family)